MYRVCVGVCVFLCSTTLAWPQAAQPVVPIVSGLVVSPTNPLPVTGSVTIPSPIATNSTVFIGGNPVAVANPFFSSPVVAGAVVSPTNPLPSNTYVAGSLVSFANPFPSAVSVGGSAISVTNPAPVYSSVGGAAVSFANPAPVGVSIGGSAVSTANPFLSAPIVAGAAVSAANPMPTAANINSRMYGAATTTFSRATAGDLLCITGSASKTVKVKQFAVGAVSNSMTSTDLSIILRSTLDTGGTPTTLTNTAFNSTNAASASVVTVYATAPTAGTTIGTVDAHKYTAVVTNTDKLRATTDMFNFGAVYDQQLTLNGATQAACLAVSAVSNGSWNASVRWSEE